MFVRSYLFVPISVYNYFYMIESIYPNSVLYHTSRGTNISKPSKLVSQLVRKPLANGSQTTCERFTNQMSVCVDGTANLGCTVCKQFAANQYFSVFCMNTKKTACTECPFHAPDVICSHQVRGN